MPTSSLSGGTRRSKTRQYRVVSNTSQIDESLFGKSNSEKLRNEMLKDKWETHSAPIERQAKERKNNRNKKPKKETIRIITKDLIRSLM